MPRLTEAFRLPSPQYFKSLDHASATESPPHSSSPKERPLNLAYSEDAPRTANGHEGEKSDEEFARAAYEARLADIHSAVVDAFDDPALQRLIREAITILQDTLAPSFLVSLGEVPNETELAKSRRIRQAQTAVWDRFFRVQQGREDLLTTPRNELKEGEKPPRSIWLAAKAEVEAGFGISHKAPEPIRRPRRG